MIIGVTGTLGAGKGTIAEVLVKKGFKHYSMSDFINEEIKKRGMEIDRSNQVLVANDLRTTFGPSYIAERVYDMAKTQWGNCIIESLRAVGEVEALRKKGEFILIAVDADPKIRYERISKRQSEKDNVTFSEFISHEQREMQLIDSTKGNIKTCMSMADFKIINNGSMKEIEEDVENILRRLGFRESAKVEKRSDAISWDDYFMGIALLSAKRSKDPSTQVGACIVNEDKRIVGIGYNGFPQGCSDEDFPWAREGTFLETKYAYVVHAEMNSILNSMGKDLRNSTLYVAMFPCNECAKSIIQTGIKRIVFLSDKYSHTDGDKASRRMFDASGVKYEKLIPKNKEILLKFEGV